MSNVAEIERAIERLPDPEIARLAAWLAEYRGRRTAAADGPITISMR